jgi:DNA-binding sugar fermentation-stimulating protein
MAKRKGRDPLLLRVCAEIGAGRITEAYIHDPGYMTEGLTEGSRITINPAHATVNVLVHECIHALRPAWSEQTVRSRTSQICRRLTDAETQAIFQEYQQLKKSRRTMKRIPKDAPR